MISFDREMVSVEKLCERVPVLKELTLPTSLSACVENLVQSSFWYVLGLPSHSYQ